MPKSTSTSMERLIARRVYADRPADALPQCPDTPCWISTLKPNTAGYTVVGEYKTVLYAHRLAYETFIGPIPDKLTIDHLCRNRACWNSEHLEPVPRRVNNARGTSPGALAVATGRCKRGHSLVDAYVSAKTGARACCICQKAHAYAKYHKMTIEEALAR